MSDRLCSGNRVTLLRRHQQQAPTPRASARQALYAFVDVETTGVDPQRDRVVEVACLVVRESATLASFSSLVQPERSIPATASAVHHLTDADVAGAPNLVALEPKLLELCSNAVIVAHNAHFDLAFLPFLRRRAVICAMRFAKLMIPDAPNYKNQVLRYHLGIADRWLAGNAAHRAPGDVALTSRVFAICLERYLAEHRSDDLDALIAAVATPRASSALDFGRHRGAAISSIPDDYLRWLAGAPAMSADRRLSARAELRRREIVA